MKAGWDLPEKIANAPSLAPGLELYYIGFQDLKSSRMAGMGLSPIWWTTIRQYCVEHGLDEEQTYAMHYHIEKMDECYLKHMTKKS